MLDFDVIFARAPHVRGAAELVTVATGGFRFSAWKRVLVRAAMNEAARSFHLEVAAELGAAATARRFKSGAPVEVFATADRLLVGHVDRYRPRLDALNAEILITGRSKAADLIDSSAVHPTGDFKGKTPDEIGQALDGAGGHGVGIRTDQALEPVDFRLTPGETIFKAVERLARSQGVTPMGEADGSINLTKAGTRRHAGGIFEGRNFTVGEADHNWSNRHSKVIVRSQRPFGHGAENLEIEAIARDTAVGRSRTVVIVQDDDADKGRAKKRAKGRRDRAAGAALRATFTLPGFRDEAGELWTPNRLVWTESPFLDIAQDMLIEAVTFGQDEGGTVSKLELVDPRAYGGKKGRGNKSGGAWEQSDDEAEG